MTDLILNRLPRLGKYLTFFDQKLGRPARQHFIHLILAFILYDGAKNLAGLNRASFNRRHLSSVDRFLTEVEWPQDEWEQLRFEDLSRRAKRFLQHQQAKGQKVPIFLCLDDTNNPKSGDQTAGVSLQYSHLQGRLVLSYCLVTAVLVVGPWVIPYDFKLYRRKAECERRGDLVQFRDKLSLAAELIEQWQPFEQTEPIVVVDSWYSGLPVLNSCAKRQFTLISGLPANRCIKAKAKGAWQQLKEYAASLSTSAYHPVTVGAKRWQLAQLISPLKQAPQIKAGKIVLARGLGNGRGERFWYCSDQSLALNLIMEYYTVRWEIETFHKQAKQLLGWCDNQCHLPKSVRRLWLLLLLAYSYLTIERVEHSEAYARWRGCSFATLWQIQQAHKLAAHQAQFEGAYQAGVEGVPLADLLGKVRA